MCLILPSSSCTQSYTNQPSLKGDCMVLYTEGVQLLITTQWPPLRIKQMQLLSQCCEADLWLKKSADNHPYSLFIVCMYSLVTADCKSLATSKLNQGKPQLCLNREVGHAEAGKIIVFICGKSIVVFHCSACMSQDFCNLL